jgi:hypothetical protein
VCLDSTSIKVHPDGTGALKKRATSHWAFPRWMHHQDSFGCRECSVRLDLKTLPRPGGRRPARAGTLSRGRSGS